MLVPYDCMLHTLLRFGAGEELHHGDATTEGIFVEQLMIDYFHYTQLLMFNNVAFFYFIFIAERNAVRAGAIPKTRTRRLSLLFSKAASLE